MLTNGEADKQRLCLERLGLTARLDCAVISAEVELAKPDPRIYALALRQLGTPASVTLFVGDSPVNDIRGPQRAGMRAAYLPTGHALPADIVPDVTLSSLSDLLTLVLQSRPPQR